jgi:fatty acid desaturase
LEQALVERQQLHRERGQALRRSAVRGLLMLALLVLVLSIARAGLGRVFVPGWWRP